MGVAGPSSQAVGRSTQARQLALTLTEPPNTRTSPTWLEGGISPAGGRSTLARVIYNSGAVATNTPSHQATPTLDRPDTLLTHSYSSNTPSHSVNLTS